MHKRLDDLEFKKLNLINSLNSMRKWLEDSKFKNSTDYGTTIDNVITNVDIAILVCESLISDHRSILLLDKNTYMQIENISR